MTAPTIAHHSHYGETPPSVNCRRGADLWEAPLLLSIAFTALVVAWAQENDTLEREALRQS